MEGNREGDRTRGEKAPEHVPVLLPEVLELVRPRAGGLYLDATLGGGGYSRALLEASAPSGRVWALDRDRGAVELAREALAPLGERFVPIWGSFEDLDEHLDRLGVDRLDAVVADLGVSSLQLDAASRGFSFSAEGPLDMRFDRSKGPAAADLVNEMEERELAEILRELGEERRAAAIARRIVARRPIRTTGELRRAVVSVLGPRRGRIDPATRTFQALRIAVNRELEALEALLRSAPSRLAGSGRLVVISYHSLEDRSVKHAFRARARGEGEGEYRILTRKPIVPGEREIASNRRARSAKLRALERVA